MNISLVLKKKSTNSSSFAFHRKFCSNKEYDGLVLGVYEDSKLTADAQRIFQENSFLGEAWKLTAKKGKSGDVATFFAENGLKNNPQAKRIAVVGLGKDKPKAEPDVQQLINESKESVRKAAAAGVRTLRDYGATKVAIESFDQNYQAAAEGSHLGLYEYTELKTPPKDEPMKRVDVVPFEANDEFTTGTRLAEAQNWARYMADTPSNLLTPTMFADLVIQKYQPLIDSGKVKVIVRDAQWAQEKKMGMFLGVAQGSDEPLRFVEIHYNSNPTAPFTLVGKGITFDSGGISIKGSAGMGEMKGDMSGAAVVASTIWALAMLDVPVHTIGLIPLCENMPSGKAIKPGDVLKAMNGKTVEVDNTDAEGRLILGDALHYADSFSPQSIINIATLTGAMSIALGPHAFGCFTNSNSLWSKMESASFHTGERSWRFPLLGEYKKDLKSNVADMKNVGGRAGGSCVAAAFLKEFVKCKQWMHCDIAGVMSSTGNGYFTKGMTGIPVRTLVQIAKSQ